MPAIPSCPAVHQWQRLLLGDVSDQEAEQLEQHLARCARCSQSLHGLRAHDTLVEAIRAGGRSEARPRGELVARLIERLKQLGPVEVSGDTQALNSLTPLSPADATQETYDFLRPPEGPGELGRLGPYRVLKVLGAGGMGVVFHAEDTQLKRPVALKALRPGLAASPTARQRFLREAQATAAVKHDHIVTIYQVGQERDVPFLAMELLPGETLDDRLKREGRLPLAEVLRIGGETAEGLAAAHERGLIHRDIKPGNLWLEGQRQRVKVLDFGLARAAGEDAHLTQTGIVVGTPAYMAPEQAKAEAVDVRCDLFSLGCVLYRMCTGEVPFKGKDSMSMLLSLAMDAPKPPRELNPDVPPPLSRLILNLLAKNPADRPVSAAVVVKVLEALEKSAPPPAAIPLAHQAAPRAIPVGQSAAPLAIPVAAPSPSRTDVLPAPKPLTAPPRRRRRLLAAVLAAAAALLTAVIVIRITTGKGEPGSRPQDPDRRVAEWVLKIGGKVKIRVGDKEQDVEAAKGLPERAFQLTGVYFWGNQQVTDATLENFKGVTNLTHVNLGACGKLGDAGLKHLQGLPGLTHLNLDSTPVTDTGLVHLKKMTKLTSLELGGTQVTDGGVAALKKALPKCRISRVSPDRRAAEWILSTGHGVWIRVADKEQEVGPGINLPAEAFQLTRVGFRGNFTDAGLANFKGCKNLTVLSLYNDSAAVSDEGLAYFKDCKDLKQLHLGRLFKVTDKGLAHFKGCNKLTHLRVQETPVTDAGLAHFKDCQDLESLDLPLCWGNRVTDKGLAHFKESKNLTVLRLESMQVTDKGLENLKGLTKLKVLSLGGCTKVSGPGLQHFEGLTNLTDLNLGDTPVSGSGLEHLKGLTKLTELHLERTRVSGPGLQHLKGLTNLRLYLDGTPMKDAGMVHLNGLTKLAHLDLNNTGVSNDGLANLKGLANLTALVLSRTQVSDDGLEHLKGLVSLKSLSLGLTRVSNDGLVHLKELKDLTVLHLEGTRVSDAGLEHLKWLKTLGELHLEETRVSADGFAGIRKVIPGTSGKPTPSLAEELLAEGAALVIRSGEGKKDRPVKKLPKEPFRVRRADCTGVKKRLAELLARLAHPREYEFERLESLDLAGCAIDNLNFAAPLESLQELIVSATKVGDLKPLSGLKSLRKLSLAGLKVADDALQTLAGLTDLRQLDLSKTEVNGRGLVHLAKLPKLAELSLASSNVSNLFAKEVGMLPKLERLSLAGCTFSDAGIERLAGMSNLKELDLRKTQVKRKGIDGLRQALPACRIEWDGGGIKSATK
jgi:Leucine-rich repeat (LRR) protein